MDDKELEKIAIFFLKYCPYVADIELIKSYIKKHFEYKTGFVMYGENKEICALCRWNMSGDGKTAEVLDLYIREDYRGKKIIQQMLLKGLWTFPSVKQISFERFKKYPGRAMKIIPIEKILKRR